MRATALVRRQLVAFSVAGLVSTVVLGVVFLRVPEALGIHRHTVTAEFEQGAGLYEGAEVTYRGHPVGKVASMELSERGVRAELRLVDDIDVPADVRAEIRSRSAVGEQYVDLVPAAGPTDQDLGEGDVIPIGRTSSPVEIGPVLDHVYALVNSIDARHLATVLDETDRALRGRTGELQSILDDGQDLIELADDNLAPTQALIRDADPLLGTVNANSAHIRALSGNLADVTGELRAGDADLRRLLADGPGLLTETTGLVDDLDQTLPPLLAPLNTISGLLAVYNPYLAGLLTEYPRSVATVQSVTLPELGTHDVRLTLSNAADPPECTPGFLPPEQWVSPFDVSARPTPLVFCRLPHDDPRGVRGARNIPCPQNPAIREGDASRCPD